MIYGNWVAIDKKMVKHLPIDRPYTELEAVFSLSIDMDNKNPVSLSGYAKLWGWSRNKVRKFISDLDLEIMEPKTKEEIRMQKGILKGHPKGQPKDTLDTKKGQPRFIFNRCLYGSKNNHDEEKGQPKDTPKDTTIDPINNPNPKKIKKASQKKTGKIEKPDSVTDQTWNDFLAHRKEKRAKVTQTALNGFILQAEKAGWSLEDALKETMERGWTGFKADWVTKDKKSGGQYDYT